MVFSTMAKRSALCICLGVSLTGCATNPPMPAEKYDDAAKIYVGIYQCGVSGRISPDSVVWGKRIMNDSLAQTYSYDLDLLNQKISSLVQYSNAQPSTEDCNKVAILATEYKQKVEANELANQRLVNSLTLVNDQIQQAYAQPSVNTVNTTCNQVGTQTFCNSSY